MSCNGLEWIQPPSNESRLPGCYAYYDPPARIVDELNRLVDRNKRLEEALDKTSKAACKHIKQLESEVYALRLYGNKDCTAMADQALKEAKP
jgi:hypothetical protein